MTTLFQKLFHSLNVRLGIVMLSISFGAFVTIRYFQRRAYESFLYDNQVVTHEIWKKIIEHPDYSSSLKTMPADLAELFNISHGISANTITFFNTLNSSRFLVIFSIFLFLGPILFLLTLVINRYITAPMQKLTTATRHLAKGDLSTRTDLNTRSWDRYSLQLAEDFNSMAGSLESLETERRNMISDIAHELRTPITAMQLQLEAVQDDIVPLTPELIDALYVETELLSSLIIDLRTLSLAEARELSLDKQSFELHNFIERVVKRFYASAQKKGIQLSIKGAEGLYLCADAERINQVLNNLMSNAIRYTPENGTVSLEVESTPKNIILSVINSGTPIPKEELTQLFNRFYRSGQGKVRAEGGSGLGLAIVKALVELHGGDVRAQNHNKDGDDCIKFSLSLPQTLPQNYS